MKINLADRIKFLSFLILMFSITSVMLISFLPTLEIDNYSTKEPISLNQFSMKDSNNSEVQDIEKNLSIINYLLWALIIFCLLSIFGIIINLSDFYDKISKVLLFFGIPVFFISCIAILLYIIILKGVIDLSTLSSPYLIEPIRYSYISLFILLFLVLSSIFYLVALTKFFITENKMKNTVNIKEKKKIPKKKTLPKKLEKKSDTKKKILSEEKQKDETIKNKKEMMENWLKDETKKLENEEPEEKTLNKEFKKEIKHETKEQYDNSKDTTFEKEKGVITEEENNIKDQEKTDEKKEIKVDNEEKTDEKESSKKDVDIVDKNIQSIDLTEKNKKIESNLEKTDIKENIKNEKTLDEALDNAIKKRGVEKKDQEQEKKETDKKEIEKYNIKCPSCSHIFAVEKKKGENKTKCPKCGKEGIIKF